MKYNAKTPDQHLKSDFVVRLDEVKITPGSVPLVLNAKDALHAKQELASDAYLHQGFQEPKIQ